MSAQAGTIAGRIKVGSIMPAVGDTMGSFVVSVPIGGSAVYDVVVLAKDLPDQHMEGKLVKAMCSDAGDVMTLIDLEVVPDPELDDRQGMFAMSLYKKTPDGRVAKFEMSRGVIPADGDVDAFVKFITKASDIAGIKALGYTDEEGS